MLLVVGAVAAAFAVPVAAAAATGPAPARYEVTITNLTEGQPLSPPVAVTHRTGVTLFQRGAPASEAIEAIAETGDQSIAVAALDGAAGVTHVVDVGAPLTPAGAVVGSFTDSVTFEIDASRGDRLSFATMLICTNDGFAGVNSLRLPKAGAGTAIHYVRAHDAGTERNTERSQHIVDACSALGPVTLDGDPDGNVDDTVDTDRLVRPHRGVTKDRDLLAAHDWDGPVAMIEVTLIENAGNVRPFDVTITNLSDGQPFSPAVVATHAPSLALQLPGTKASAAIEAIAEDGDQSAAVARLANTRRVTDVVDVGAPLTPAGTAVGDFTDEVTFEITGRPADQLSLAAMLICTNDGLVLGDRLPLPASGSVTFYLFGWDAGTEANTESSADIVDPCSLLGPVALDGDPNGNMNAGIDTDGAVLPHPGIEGSADLLLAHGWDEPVAMVTISTE